MDLLQLAPGVLAIIKELLAASRRKEPVSPETILKLATALNDLTEMATKAAVATEIQGQMIEVLLQRAPDEVKLAAAMHLGALRSIALRGEAWESGEPNNELAAAADRMMATFSEAAVTVSTASTGQPQPSSPSGEDRS